nr:AKR_HP1_G0018180.mRNA.1.CDS.1 [Saccharomyces cerevisiae]
MNLKKISSFKSLIDEDLLDTQTFSVLLQQLLTPGSKISSNDLDKFFQKKIHLYEKKLEDYFRFLCHIKCGKWHYTIIWRPAPQISD